MKFELRRIIATLLLFVTITGLVMSISESIVCAGELPGAHETVNISHDQDAPQIHGNIYPSSSTTDDHFCFDNCGCPCNAPLLSRSITHSASRLLTPLVHAEQAKHAPEVYFSLFVPPDSTNV
jgi:hypothetical protein